MINWSIQRYVFECHATKISKICGIFQTLSKVRESYSVVLILQSERYMLEETNQFHTAN